MKGQGVAEPTLGRLESDELVRSIMEGVLRTPQERRRTLAFVRPASVVVVAVLLVAGGLIAVPRLTSFGTTGGSALSTYHADGLRFDYPAAWTLTQSSTVIGATRIVAFVGTGEGAAECNPVAIPTGGGERLCSLFSASLAPDQIVLEIAVDDTTPWQPAKWLNPPDSARSIVVGGLPAMTGPSVVVPYRVGADVVTCWVLTSLQNMNRHYVLTAAIRGPDLAGLQAQVDALLASVTFYRPK
jgi:hypothetical protein